MVTRVSTIVFVGVAWSCLAAAALVQAGQPPPASTEAAKPADGEQPVKTQRVPFLGSATKEATPQQRAEAGLPAGVGLVVQHVLSGSPAEAAGLARGDVLHKLNDQILINDPQFRVLLRMVRPGEEVQFAYVRQGKSHTATAHLSEREVPVGEVPAGELLQWLLRPTGRSLPPEMATALSASYEDSEHVLVLSSDESGRHLLAKDKQGAVLFDGPIDTPEQRKAVPEVLRPKLSQLESPPKPKGASL